ncbi:transposase [Nocardia sp. NEAU-351]|uniref:Transposase n=1 Tax=Nocardia bovistercoris TaxID=2785916 RepID=A0A931IJJ0_9NOCA|nr:transposase [Nocardia bovistercoris]
MVDVLSQRLVPDGLWVPAEPLSAKFESRAQGGGTAPVDERVVFTAVVFVLTSGCAWRMLPPSFRVTVPTAHRRFTDAASIRAKEGDAMTGPSPVDRGKSGSKPHVLSDRAGIRWP